jgi:hypothetical protein
MMCIDFWRLGQQTQPTLSRSQVSFLPSFIAVYQAAACLSTMRCGNLWNTSIRLPMILLLGRLLRITQKALWHHHIFLEKWPYLGSVWTDTNKTQSQENDGQETERTINYPNGYSYLIVRSSTSKRRRSISRAC